MNLQAVRAMHCARVTLDFEMRNSSRFEHEKVAIRGYLHANGELELSREQIELLASIFLTTHLAQRHLSQGNISPDKREGAAA
jgi:hypothetical protein